MQGFRSPGSAQRFLAAHAAVANTFTTCRHLISATIARLMTELAIRDPEHVGIGAPLLGHRASASARHYNLAGQHEAAREWQELVVSRRREARRRRR